jgi:hypothetical protein
MRHLAQANIARQRGPLDSPVMRGFVVALDPVNRIAERSPGFVWRLGPSQSHGATTLRDGSFPVIVNLSVWESYEALHAFVYHSPHGAYLRRRARWFEPSPQPSTVLWWVEAGQRPTVEEALRRLRHPRALAAGLHPAAALRAGRPTHAPRPRRLGEQLVDRRERADQADDQQEHGQQEAP